MFTEGFGTGFSYDKPKKNKKTGCVCNHKLQHRIMDRISSVLSEFPFTKLHGCAFVIYNIF